MTLAIPGSARPTNLHLTPEQIHWDLDADTLHWLEHLPDAVEGGDRLFVLIHKDHDEPFVIVEHADDGSDMFVMRTAHLDERTYERLRYMRQVPLDKRIERLDRIAADWEREDMENRTEEMYERFGGDMRWQLYRDGFIDSPGVSMPLRNPTAKRHRAEGRKKKLWKGAR